MSPEELAARYFDDHIGPALEADGMPAAGIEHLRQRYIRDLPANPAGLAQVRELYGESGESI